jgi:hypothetical protein
LFHPNNNSNDSNGISICLLSLRQFCINHFKGNCV